MTIVCKPFVTWDKTARLVRCGRVMWERGTVGDGKGYSGKVSFALWVSRHGLLRYWRENNGFIVSFLGLRLHYDRSYGGRFV